MSAAHSQIEQMHADLQAWEQAVSSRDTELRNLQVGYLYLPISPGTAANQLGRQLGTPTGNTNLMSNLQSEALDGQLASNSEEAPQNWKPVDSPEE